MDSSLAVSCFADKEGASLICDASFAAVKMHSDRFVAASSANFTVVPSAFGAHQNLPSVQQLEYDNYVGGADWQVLVRWQSKRTSQKDDVKSKYHQCSRQG
jgi:hypothetical protein